MEITSWGSREKCASPSETEQAARALGALPVRGPAQPWPRPTVNVLSLLLSSSRCFINPKAKEKGGFSSPRGENHQDSEITGISYKMENSDALRKSGRGRRPVWHEKRRFFVLFWLGLSKQEFFCFCDFKPLSPLLNKLNKNCLAQVKIKTNTQLPNIL